MRFSEFENIMSETRMNRYLVACGGDSKKAMTLYRLNLRLSQELFTVISCFELALRNAINKHNMEVLGNDWLKNGALPNGIFDNNNCKMSSVNIKEAVNKLNHFYSHNKL